MKINQRGKKVALPPNIEKCKNVALPPNMQNCSLAPNIHYSCEQEINFLQQTSSNSTFHTFIRGGKEERGRERRGEREGEGHKRRGGGGGRKALSTCFFLPSNFHFVLCDIFFLLFLYLFLYLSFSLSLSLFLS